MGAAIEIAWKTIFGLLGKAVEDPTVKTALAKCGKVTMKPDFIIAKDAGFDFAIGRPEGAKRTAPKVLDTLFLYAEGRDKHHAFGDLPKPFAFGLTRAELLAAAGPPAESWKIGKGKVDVDSKGVDFDTWMHAGYEVRAGYGSEENRVRGFDVTLADEVEEVTDAKGAVKKVKVDNRDLSIHPLHFETAPVDEPPDAELVGMALLVAWSAIRFGLPPKHARTELGTQLLAREITPRTFLVKACKKKLDATDCAPELGDFLWTYTNRMSLLDDDERAPSARTIKKWLNLEKADERAYSDDFLGTFKGAVKNPFYVPDSWDAVERIAPVLDARWADFQATRFSSAPDLKLYEQAAKLRDARTVTPAKQAVTTRGLDDDYATQILALVEQPLSDKSVRAALERAGLPIGKKIDEQANPALGISYMGSKLAVKDKKALCVTAVTFHGAKQKSYIRGLGKEVEFRAYPAPLPKGVHVGDARAAVRKAWGTPHESSDDMDYWFPSKTRRISAKFSKNDKLAYANFGLPAEWLDPPKPPFTGVGVF